MAKRKVKKHEDGIVVEFNKDRDVIENGESWVYADSLNIAEVLNVEHKEVLRRIRKILDEYEFKNTEKDGGLNSLSSESKATTALEDIKIQYSDFSYSISEYINSQNKPQPYYKLSKDLLVLVMFAFSRLEKAKRFQIKYVEEFNRKEKELQWHRARYMGIDVRNSLTDNIKDYLENPQWYDYMNFTNLVYEALYGMDAKEIRLKYGLDKRENIRKYLSEECLKQVEHLENRISGMLEYGEDYETISKKVRKKHFGEIQELILNVDEKEI